MEPEILDSARSAGSPTRTSVTRSATPSTSPPNQGDYDLTVAVGPALNAVTLLEVGFDTADDGRIVIVHAMKARKKYL